MPTVKLGLPYIATSQYQKEVTHAEALNRLDAMVQLAALDYANDPPGSPSNGQVYLVGASPTGAWSGQAQAVAAYLDGTWIFFAPNEGWLAFDVAAGGYRHFDSSTWVLGFGTGSGATVFTQLSDAIASYTGQGGKVVGIKADESGLEAVDMTGGAATFLDLTDTPAAYAGQASKVVRVAGDETGLEFVTPTSGPTTLTGLSDTPASYSGQGLKALVVNAAETALEFVSRITTFLGLTDTPAGYGGQAGKTLIVNAAENGLAFVDFPVGGESGASLGTYLVSGGAIVWVSGLTFRVSAATYYLDGALVSSVEQEITLDAADPTDDRIDVIVLNGAGTASAITGTPSTPPTESPVDPSLYLRLGIAYVAAGASAPSVSQEVLYQENAEWTAVASAASLVVDSTTDPRSGTLNIEGTSVAAGHYVELTRPSDSVDLASFDLLVLYVRLKASWPSKKSLRLSWYASGVLRGAQVTVGNGNFGLNTQLTGSYQQVVIPVSQFAVPAGSAIDRLRIEVVGSGGSVGFHLDDLSLQGDVTTPPAPTDTSFLQLTDTPVSYDGQAGRDVRVKADGSGLEFYPAPYDVGVSLLGTPTADAVLVRYPFPRAVSFPAGMTGSQGVCGTAPSAETVFSLQKNGVEFGTMTFAESATTATFAAASATSFAAGDVLTVIAPSALNGLADLGFSLAGTR